MSKNRKYKVSRFEYENERDALAALANTKRGKGKNFSDMIKRHSNFEWIFIEKIE